MGMEKISKIQAINAPPPKSWDDYRSGCHNTYNGGWHEDREREAFHHGMDTVFNLLEGEFPPVDLCKAALKMAHALNIISKATSESLPPEPVNHCEHDLPMGCCAQCAAERYAQYIVKE